MSSQLECIYKLAIDVHIANKFAEHILRLTCLLNCKGDDGITPHSINLPFPWVLSYSIPSYIFRHFSCVTHCRGAFSLSACSVPRSRARGSKSYVKTAISSATLCIFKSRPVEASSVYFSIFIRTI